MNRRVSPQTMEYSPAMEYYSPVKINKSEPTAYAATWMSLTNTTTSKKKIRHKSVRHASTKITKFKTTPVTSDHSCA